MNRIAALSILLELALLPAAVRGQSTFAPRDVEGEATRTTTTTRTTQTLKVDGSEIVSATEGARVVRAKNGARRADGTMPIEVTLESVKSKPRLRNGDVVELDADAAAPPVDDPQVAVAFLVIKSIRGASYTVAVDDRGTAVSVTGTEAIHRRAEAASPQVATALKTRFSPETVRRQFNQSRGAFPGKPVKPSDSWTRDESVEIGGTAPLAAKRRYTYEGTIQKGGATLDRVTVRTSDPSYKAALAPGFQVEVARSELKVASSEGEVLIDRAAGRIVESSEKTRYVGVLTLVADGKEYPAELDLTIETKSTSEKAAK